MAQAVILAIALFLPFFQTPEPGARHELALRLRYPDGRPVAGVAVALLKLPDRTPVGWHNTDSACQTDAQGLCVWQLLGGLYEFSFPAGLAPDPITLTELGEGGLNNLSVFLDRDYAMGLVLADPLTRAAGDSLFFDRTPDEARPQFHVPGPRDARQHHVAPTAPDNVVVVDLEQQTPTAPAIGETINIADGDAGQVSPAMLLLALLGLLGLVVIGILLVRRQALARARARAMHYSGLSQEEEEDGPWA